MRGLCSYLIISRLLTNYYTKIQVRRHKDARAEQMVTKNAELETEVLRLSKEVDAQAQVTSPSSC